MTELLVATTNRGKLVEIEALLAQTVSSVLSLDVFPDLPAVVEDGNTFEENALKKARVVAMATGKAVIADDSGLVVDCLDGRPGVYSARFAGDGATDAENNKRLLEELEGVLLEQRTGAFRCVVALCMPDGTCRTFDGELRGEILASPRGEGGFGYDPLFLVPAYGLTLAELSLETKNGISHRGKALAKLKEFLVTI